MLPVAVIVKDVPLPLATEYMELEVMAVEEDVVSLLLEFWVWFRDLMENITHVSSK